MTPRALAAMPLLLLLACQGANGHAGPDGLTGPTGPGGNDGDDGLSPWFTATAVDVEVTELAVSAAGATVTFRLDDLAGPGGAPLDRTGRLTEGTVEVGFVLAQLSLTGSGLPGPYAPYTTAIVGGALQGVAESDPARLETLDVAAGLYRYTFAAPLAGFDPSRTQTVVATARRSGDRGVRLASASSSVRPDGGTAEVREVVGDAACTACHGTLTAHGGRHAGVAQCLGCHAPGTADPETGASLDLRVMVHKIHRGAELPSVVAGGTYALVGAEGPRDYSTVRFPRSIRDCQACHAGAQADAWSTRPSVAVCSSCHDDVAFVDPTPAGMVRHNYGVTEANACDLCHGATTGVAPVVASHLDPALDRTSELALLIRPMSPVAPGTSPTFTFEVTVNGQPRNLQVAPLSTLRATLAGPNGDFTIFWTSGTSSNPYVQATMQGSGAIGTLSPVDAAAGVFAYTFPATIVVPASATGSFTVGLEGSISSSAPRFVAVGPTRAFAVTDAVASPRRAVVEPARCDACHGDLTAHGGGRRGAEGCLLCHNGENANGDRVSRLEGSTVLAESVDFRVMIHKLHAGGMLTQPYVLGTNPTPTVTNPAGMQRTWNGARYPRSPAECGACHAPGTWALPTGGAGQGSILQELTCGEDVAADTNSYCTSPFWTVTQTFRLPPQTAVCTSCHDAPHVVAHAALATTAQGAESCATCHGPGSTWDVEAVHEL